MKGQDYTVTFSVTQTPEQVFAAVNNIRGWWSEEIEGNTDTIGDVWKYHYRDAHRCTMKVTGLIPGKRVDWLVLDNYFDFTKDKTEWKGTTISFDIQRKGNQTEVRFTHKGLVPDYECYELCSNAWGSYIKGSLQSLITAGKGKPNQKES